MKTKFLIYIIAFTISFTAQAQFPNFIKVDTGAITIMPGGHGSSTCFDIDNDGDMDIATMNSGTYINRNFSIYKNERNGLFIKIPDFISIDDSRNLSSFGDVDNDGNIDLFTGLPSNKLHYFVNDGYGNYHYDTTIFLNTSTLYPSLIDLNNDGFLDIVGIDRMGGVIYNDSGEGFLHCTSLGLFQEQQDVSLHGMSWGDVDDDGDLDFFGGYSPNSNNAIPKNLCYLNNGNGEFVEFDPSSIIVEGECTTTCANWVDYDNDGDMDLYVHNVICDNMLPALYENLGDMQFTRHDIVDEKYRYSLANSSVWGDLDNDADLDLYISIENNPFPWPPPDTSATPYNVLYLNDGNGQFTEFLDEQHPLVNEDTHTAMLLDYDNDGDLDVLLTRYGWTNTGHDNLFVNGGNDNSWIVLTCEGTISNRSAIGTRVQAKAFVNGKHITQTREITPINGHLSYANLRVHFGLGDADVIDTLIFRWPSGIVDTYFDVRSKRFYRAIEDSGLVFLCPQGDISFTTQEEIDNFPFDNPDCIEIAGNVTISGSNITNLDGLLQIEILGGNLEISGNDSLTDLTGLNNITVIEGSLHIHNNEMLINCTGLDSLLSIGGSLTINGNDSLKSLHGLENLTKIDSTLLIDWNADLCNLSGLDNISSIGGNFEVNHGGAFTDFHGMENLISVGGDFLIGWNSNAIFHGNPQLCNLTGLDNLSIVGGDLVIASSDSLKNLIGLENLIDIGGNLRIGGHPALETLNGLDNLTSIGGNLRIGNNSLLTDITSLNNLDASSIMNLTIEDNNSLSSCELQSICKYLLSPNGTIEIHDNAAGCNSEEEVKDACPFDVRESSDINNLSIYPNPANTILNISAEGFTIDEVKIFTIAGQKVLIIRPKSESIDISSLPRGMYIVEASLENRKVRQKLVIE